MSVRGVGFDGGVPFSNPLLAPDGTQALPSYAFTSSPSTGFWTSNSATNVRLSIANTDAFYFGTGFLNLGSGGILSWSATAGASGAGDNNIARVGPSSLQFGSSIGTTSAVRVETNKAVAAIANAVATSVLTITIPNAAHSASVRVRVTGSLGAGGAIGANEATAVNEYIVSVTRTAGVNAAVAISAAYGAAASAVVGAATVTCTAALAAVAGAVGATNTCDVQVTISRSAGSSTNHTCLVYSQLMNANSAGVTIA